MEDQGQDREAHRGDETFDYGDGERQWVADTGDGAGRTGVPSPPPPPLTPSPSPSASGQDDRPEAHVIREESH